jgi:hypothetical protein
MSGAGPLMLIRKPSNSGIRSSAMVGLISFHDHTPDGVAGASLR